MTRTDGTPPATSATVPRSEAGPAKITVLGAGSWGTTFAKVLADAAADAGAERTVCLWGRCLLYTSPSPRD